MRLIFTLLLFISVAASAQCDYQLNVVQPGCSNTGSITVTNLTGVAPFIITGAGTNLSPGTYNVKVIDATGCITTRTVTLVPYSFTFDLTLPFPQNIGCGNFLFQMAATANVTYGYSVTGDTSATWITGNSFTVSPPLGSLVYIYAKDSCGNIVTKEYHMNHWTFGAYIVKLDFKILCDKVDVYPEYAGFDAPNVCLYDFATKALIQCKQAPANYNGGALTNFFNLDFTKDYYVIVQDSCYRDSMYFPVKESFGGSQIDPYDWDCTTFKMHVDAPAPPASWFAANPGVRGSPDSICLFRQSDNSLVGCKPDTDYLNWINPRTGLAWESGAVWDNLPYGCYYAYIYDPCMDSTFKIDSCVTYPNKFNTTLYNNCAVNQSAIQSNFDPGGKRPFTTQIIYPNGVIAVNDTSTNANNYILYNTYPQAGTITVIQGDGCGYKDTSYLFQPAIFPVRNIKVHGGCLGASGTVNYGDIVLSGNAIAYAAGPDRPLATVKIISPTTINYNYTATVGANQDFHFTNIPAGTYIIESSVGCFGFKVYDTVTIKPYSFPKQYMMLTGCSGGFVGLKDSLSGIGPFTVQMTSPYPYTTTTNGSVSFLFGIDTSFIVNVIITDACGNSQTATVTINPASCKFLNVIDNAPQTRIDERLIKVYPNPSNGRFVVSISSKKKQDYNITMYSNAGVKVYEEKLLKIDKKDFVIDKPFTKGMYYMKVNEETFKIIIN